LFIQGEDLGNDGATREQMQGQELQGLQGTQFRLEVRQVDRGQGRQGLHQGRPLGKPGHAGERHLVIGVQHQDRPVFRRKRAVFLARRGIQRLAGRFGHSGQQTSQGRAEIARREERGVFRQDAQQRLGQLLQEREVEAIEQSGRRRRPLVPGGQQLGQAGQGGDGSALDLDVAVLERGGQVEAAQGKHQEGIAVDFPAEQVDGRRQVFARHRPVRAGAVHGQVGPAGREDGDAQFRSQRQQGRIELPVEHAGNQDRIGGNPIQQFRSVLGRDQRYRDGDLIEPGALHPRLDGA